MNIRSYRIGAWLWIICGAGHLAGDIAIRSNPPASSAALNTMLRSTTFELLGLHRTEYAMTMGFSQVTGILLMLAGVLFLLLARLTTDIPSRARPAGITGLIASVGLLAYAAVVFPPPPILCFTLASIAFSAALLRRPAPDPAASTPAPA